MVTRGNEKLSIDLREAYDIINKSNLVIFKWTLSDDIPTEFVSESIQIFGYRPEDFYDAGDLKDYWSFVYPEDRERVKNELYHARQQGTTSYKNQYRIITKSGDVRWVEEWVIHERDESGNLLHEKGILRDITDSVIISERLKSSEARYKELFDNASAFIFTISESDAITTSNRSFSQLLGIETDNQTNIENINTYFSTAFITKLAGKSFYTYCLSRIEEKVEVEFLLPTGYKMHIELSNRVIKHPQKKDEIQLVGTDITEKKFAEEKIKYLSTHDPLTGLNNRLSFDEKLVDLDLKGERGICIIVGDVNGLKMVNDAFGHRYGDQLLVAISEILNTIFDDEDFITRLSGDEFAIITRKRDIPKWIKKIDESCKALDRFPFIVDISLGFAIKKDTHQTLDNLFREADHSMYRSKLRRSRRIKLDMIESLKKQLEIKSIETAYHSRRMTKIASDFGKFIGLNDIHMEELTLAVSVHDIGMVSVDKSLIDKPGKLTESEFNEVKKHAEIGYHLLIATPTLANVGEYVLSHHENFDGTGYPQGLKGNEIPYIARIIAVVDSYESMTRERIYHGAIGHDKAISELERLSGKRYDPKIVAAFVAYYEQVKA